MKRSTNKAALHANDNSVVRPLSKGTYSTARQARANKSSAVVSIYTPTPYGPTTNYTQSYLEAQVLMSLAVRSDVKTVIAQPKKFDVVIDGKSVTRRFDIVTHMMDDTVTLIGVRPQERTEILKKEREQIAPQLVDFAHRIALVSEENLDRVSSHNAQIIFSANAKVDPIGDQSIKHYVMGMTTARDVRSIVKAVGFDYAYDAVLRAIGKGTLQLVKNEIIDDLTLVQPQQISADTK